MHLIICGSKLVICYFYYMYESYTTMNKKHLPHDVGFSLTKKITTFLKQNKNINELLSQINTIILLSIKGHITLIAYIDPNEKMPDRVLILMFIRLITGSATKMPLLKEYKKLETTYDFPGKGNKFFFMFSGHTLAFVSWSLYMYDKRFISNFISVPIMVIIYLFQSIRLISTRGHYTNDIIIGTILSFLLHYAMPNAMPNAMTNAMPNDLQIL